MVTNIAMGIALVASAGLFGAVVGKTIRFSGEKGTYVGLATGALIAIAAIAVFGIDMGDRDGPRVTTACQDNGREQVCVRIRVR